MLIGQTHFGSGKGVRTKECFNSYQTFLPLVGGAAGHETNFALVVGFCRLWKSLVSHHNATKNDPNRSQGGARYPRRCSYRNNSGRNMRKGDAEYLQRKCDDRHISEHCHFISGQNLLFWGYIDECVVSES